MLSTSEYSYNFCLTLSICTKRESSQEWQAQVDFWLRKGRYHEDWHNQISRDVFCTEKTNSMSIFLRSTFSRPSILFRAIRQLHYGQKSLGDMIWSKEFYSETAHHSLSGDCLFHHFSDLLNLDRIRYQIPQSRKGSLPRSSQHAIT
jgi:hypothetical protein